MSGWGMKACWDLGVAAVVAREVDGWWKSSATCEREVSRKDVVTQEYGLRCDCTIDWHVGDSITYCRLDWTSLG